MILLISAVMIVVCLAIRLFKSRTEAISQLIAPPFTLLFLQPSLAFVPIYIWSRKNTHEQVAILGLIQLPAPYVFPFSELAAICCL